MRYFCQADFFKFKKENIEFKIPWIQIMGKGRSPDNRAHICNSDFIIVIIISCIYLNYIYDCSNTVFPHSQTIESFQMHNISLHAVQTFFFQCIVIGLRLHIDPTYFLTDLTFLQQTKHKLGEIVCKHFQLRQQLYTLLL